MYPSITRKAKKPSRIQVSDRYLPGSIVCQAATPSAASTASAITRRPLPAGLRSTTIRNTNQQNKWCTGKDSNLRSSKERQIYSLLPLTTRPPVHPLPAAWTAAHDTDLRTVLRFALEPCRRLVAKEWCEICVPDGNKQYNQIHPNFRCFLLSGPRAVSSGAGEGI